MYIMLIIGYLELLFFGRLYRKNVKNWIRPIIFTHKNCFDLTILPQKIAGIQIIYQTFEKIRSSSD